MSAATELVKGFSPATTNDDADTSIKRVLSVIPFLAKPNAFTANQTINGNLIVNGQCAPLGREGSLSAR